LREFVGRHIGMHEVLRRVIDIFQLMVELEQVLNRILHGADRMSVRRAAAGLHHRAFRRNQLVQQ
jgi:hypothetical protein